MIKGLIIAGLTSTLIATIFLYLGSKHLPWNMQTIGGKSDKEIRFYDVRQRYTKIGFGLLFLVV